ncbi:MAG: hypothetical protein JXB46_00960 [Candidatus Eisenbacteria bacterium]|nr:hypothetical protein [Candidatus Eisenbacteria bacterium]
MYDVERRPCAAIALLFLCIAMCGTPCSAATHVVDHAGNGDFATIQEGIDAATYGDTVLVKAGIYHETPHVGPSADGVSLVSESGPELTIVTADSLYPRSVLTCEGVGPATVIRGFTFRAGYTNEPGGGIQCTDAGVSIEGNIIRDNWSLYEGGGVSLWLCHARLEDNLIISNRATDGGGVSVTGGVVTIQRNTLADNIASGLGGTQFGGGILIVAGEHDVSWNTIAGNYSSVAGGGILMSSVDACDVHDNVIRENEAPTGGGLYLRNTTAEIRGNVVAANSSSSRGAAVFCRDLSAPYSSPVFTDNILHNNTCVSGGAVAVNDGPSPVFNSNFFVNRASAFELVVGASDASLVLDFTGNWWGTADSAAIAELIWDCEDDSAVEPCVDVSGWCIDPSCSGQATSVQTPEGTTESSWGRIKSLYR